MQRPSGVTYTAAVMVLTTVLGIIGTLTGTIPAPPPGSPASPQMMAMFVHAGVFVGAIIGGIFIFLYWKGYSWVRWAVMIYCLFPLLSLISIKKTFAISPISGGKRHHQRRAGYLPALLPEHGAGARVVQQPQDRDHCLAEPAL